MASSFYDPQAKEGAAEIPPDPESGTGRASQSTSSLLRELVDEAGALLRAEVELAGTETRASLLQAQRGVGGMVAGAVALSCGIQALAAAAILALSRIWSPWTAACVVGVALCVLGAILVAAAKRKISAAALKPSHTLDSLREAQAFIRYHRARATEKWQ